MIAIVVFLGAGLGGLARYALGGWVQQAAGAAFPWGTFIINVTGSLLLGFLVAFLEGIAASPTWRLFLTIGFCGGYTTFSTFSYESMRLLQDSQWARAAAYIAGSTVLSIAAAFAGFALALQLLRRG